MNSMKNIFLSQKIYSKKLRTSSCEDRLLILRKLNSALRRRQEEILVALQADFSKAPVETLLTEILPVLSELEFCIKNLKKWMKPKRVSTPLVLFGARSEIYSEPRGTCLIISPWNYPFNLAMTPLLSALAAGNTVILKPSELTPQTSKLISSICEEVFPPELVSVFLGGKEVAEQLLQLPFDHIFFTGSTQVGRIVMRAAAEHLATVTLELGGKSPVIVDSSCDLKWAVQKIAWGKSVNAGQTCVAPDYVFVHKSLSQEFIRLYWDALKEFYLNSNTPSHDLAHIVNAQNEKRIRGLVSQSRMSGGVLHSPYLTISDHDTSESGDHGLLAPGIMDLGEIQTLAPSPSPSTTALTLPMEGQPKNQGLLSEEIFGPILPLMSFENIQDVIGYINEGEKPLALYIFSKDSQTQERLLRETSSGGVLINDVLLHLMNPHLPFGGVNQSGHGSYHGQFGFRAFSHQKSVMKQRLFGRAMKLFYPPYTPAKQKLAELLIWLRL